MPKKGVRQIFTKKKPFELYVELIFIVCLDMWIKWILDEIWLCKINFVQKWIESEVICVWIFHDKSDFVNNWIFDSYIVKITFECLITKMDLNFGISIYIYSYILILICVNYYFYLSFKYACINQIIFLLYINLLNESYIYIYIYSITFLI